jgi:hypothetical protein
LEDGYKKPYFLFGDATRPVDIWFTEMKDKLAQRYVGQYQETGRNFQPLVMDVRVRGLYNRDEIAFLVQWDDVLADTGGGNSPLTELEAFDFDAADAEMAGAGDDGGSIWGDEETTDDGGDFWGGEEATDDGGDFWGDEAATDDGGDFWGEDEGDAAATPAGPGANSQWELEDGYKKPYFLFGDATRPVDIWFTEMKDKLAQRYVGQGIELLTEADASELEVYSRYEYGTWSVVFKRALKSAEGRPIAENEWVPIAFSTWDGFNEERGAKRGVTQWFWFYTEPAFEPSATQPMVKAALGTLLVQVVLIFLIRRRYAGQER